MSDESFCCCFCKDFENSLFLNWPRQHFLSPFVLSLLGCALIVASPPPNRLGSQPFWFSYPLGGYQPACKTRCMSCVTKVCFVLCVFFAWVLHIPHWLRWWTPRWSTRARQQSTRCTGGSLSLVHCPSSKRTTIFWMLLFHFSTHLHQIHMSATKIDYLILILLFLLHYMTLHWLFVKLIFEILHTKTCALYAFFPHKVQLYTSLILVWGSIFPRSFCCSCFGSTVL